MAKFMLKVTYSTAGLQGSLKDGFKKREAYVKKVVKGMGAKVESVHWALGTEDGYVIVEGPAANVVAVSLAMASTGAGKIATVPLLSAAEMDEAAGLISEYRAPGG